jgi:hypothetical protein
MASDSAVARRGCAMASASASAAANRRERASAPVTRRRSLTAVQECRRANLHAGYVFASSTSGSNDSFFGLKSNTSPVAIL